MDFTERAGSNLAGEFNLQTTIRPFSSEPDYMGTRRWQLSIVHDR